MTNTRALVIVALTWLVIGLVVGVVMRRRGHDFWIWLVLGAILGPLALPLAIERARLHPVDLRYRPATEKTVGGFDVLAGIDGSEESVAAVRSALALFGDSVTSLSLAMVLDYEAASSYTGAEIRAEAEDQLARVVREIGFEPVSATLLFGRPDEALRQYALECGIELIVVGARGHGLSEALFGSVTGRLVGGAGVPILVSPRSDVGK
jgi:nucleotide-binding universal stress UspA family protein